MTREYTKTGQDALGEAAGLRWLAEAQPDGGARVARVLRADAEELAVEYIDSAPANAEAARAFGAALAHTHAAGAPWWGAPPRHWPGAPTVGRSRTPLVLHREQAATHWGEFYAAERIEPFASRLRESGSIDDAGAHTFAALCTRLREGEWDAPQPALVREAGHDVARAHGDLWAGNVLYDGGVTGAALIDPMAHGGHAETDLATLSVFGFPHLEDVVAGYDAESALAAGWQDRLGLHQLGIVIMHAHLFGGGYVHESLALGRAQL